MGKAFCAGCARILRGLFFPQVAWDIKKILLDGINHFHLFHFSCPKSALCKYFTQNKTLLTREGGVRWKNKLRF